MVEDRELKNLKKELEKKTELARIRKEKIDIQRKIKDLTPSKSRDLKKAFFRGAKIVGRASAKGLTTGFRVAQAAGRNFEAAGKPRAPPKFRTTKRKGKKGKKVKIKRRSIRVPVSRSVAPIRPFGDEFGGFVP